MAKKTVKKTAKKKTGTAVAVHKPAVPAGPRTFHETLMELGRDKSVDVTKMQAVLDMRAKENARDAQIIFDSQMAELQPALPTIKKTGEIVIRDKNKPDVVLQRTKHAKWEVIHRVITPILHVYGFALRHHVGTAPDGRVTVTAMLSHKAGHREETTITLPYDTTGSKNNVQAIGSSISYGKRYTAAAILNLNFEGDDDDGMRGGGTPTLIIDNVISADQVKRLQTAMTKSNIPAARVTDYVSKLAKEPIPSINDIPLALFEETMRTVEQHVAGKR